MLHGNQVGVLTLMTGHLEKGQKGGGCPPPKGRGKVRFQVMGKEVLMLGNMSLAGASDIERHTDWQLAWDS